MALLIAAACLCGALGTPLHAQEASPAADSGDTLEANPNRPSSSNSAEVLAPGVVQWEYGWSREWEGASDLRSVLGGEVRFGLGHNVEVRAGGDSLVDVTSPVDHHFGFGDQYLSGQDQLTKQGAHEPSLAASYAISFPTGSAPLGLGSGSINHSFTFLASKDIHKFTWDFNSGYQLMGRGGPAGFDRDAFFILTAQRDIYGPLSVIGEIGTTTRVNPATPAFSTTLWALAYKLNKRVVLDAAVDVGITHGAPEKRIMFGFTYAIANLRPKF